MGGDSNEQQPLVTRFSIELEGGDNQILHGGEVIRGKLLVQLAEKTTLQAVRLQMKGRAVWLGDGAAHGEFEKVYFNQDMTLLERPPGRPEPGHFPWIANFTYSLPFEAPMPKGCPTSYEGPFGSIRYYIKATLVEETETSQKKEHYVKKALMLLAPSDGNHIEGPPVSATETAAFGKCCCKGKIAAELSLSRSAYLPGESIYGSIKINGKKPKQIFDQVEIRLVDRVLRVGTPDKMGASPWRTLVARRPERDSKQASADGLHDIFLCTVPAVAPSTKGNFESATGEMTSMAPAGLASSASSAFSSSLYESPSTATLRFRRQPFLRIQYAVQVSIGNLIILETPITVSELPVRALSPTVGVKPFVAGAQPIEEPSDAGKVALGGPFSYTPVYPVREESELERVLPQTLVAAVSNGHHKEAAQESASSPIKEKAFVVEPVGDTHTTTVEESSQPGHKITHDVDETVEEVHDDEGRLIGTVTQRVETIRDHSAQVITTSGAGDEIVREMQERLEDGWGPEGKEGEAQAEDVQEVTTVETGDDGVAVTTTRTTTLLTRTKRLTSGEEVQEVGEKTPEEEHHPEVHAEAVVEEAPEEVEEEEAKEEERVDEAHYQIEEVQEEGEGGEEGGEGEEGEGEQVEEGEEGERRRKKREGHEDHEEAVAMKAGDE